MVKWVNFGEQYNPYPSPPSFKVVFFTGSSNSGTTLHREGGGVIALFSPFFVDEIGERPLRQSVSAIVTAYRISASWIVTLNL